MSLVYALSCALYISCPISTHNSIELQMCLPIDSLDYATLNLYDWFSSILARVMTSLELDHFVRAGLFTALTLLPQTTVRSVSRSCMKGKAM